MWAGKNKWQTSEGREQNMDSGKIMFDVRPGFRPWKGFRDRNKSSEPLRG